MGDRAGQQGSSARASRLYPSLSFLEISVYTATWICGVMYSLYSLYRASLEQVSLLGLWFPQSLSMSLFSGQARQHSLRS